MEDRRDAAYTLSSDNLHDGHAYPSAYTAPAHLRPQAEPDHSSDGQRKRGDLTADNLERIPEADQVAPGIRLETAGNDYSSLQRQGRSGEHSQSQGKEQEGQREEDDNDEEQQVNVEEHGSDDRMMLDDQSESARYAARAPLSMDLSGRDSAYALERHTENDEEPFHDADMASDDEEDKSEELVHERVGGSGATSENASKGTSVGHFGPRGEAIPGVPPHLDPRQPHFRPPSPSAASVFSVAVQPPASPKAQAASGVQSVGAAALDVSTGDVVDSGEETESFDNGALTPTLSDDFVPDDDTEERAKLPSDQMDGAYSKPGPSFSMNRMNIDGDDAMATSSSGPYQVSFSPVVTSHRGSISSYSARAPSVAATAGSSRAPSTRGLSPPASASHAGTTEGSSVGEFSHGLGDEAGAETPSVGRSRRSSYSAPSSEHEGGPIGGAAGGNGTGGIATADAAVGTEDVSSRARGSTLISTNQPNSSHGVPLGLSTTASSTYADAGEDEGPSLAPSEAGSDSTRSMTYESSTGHGSSAQQPSLGLGPATTSSERIPSSWAIHSSAGGSAHSILGAGVGSSEELTSQEPLGSASSGTFKHGTTTTPMLPSLLAIKRASRRHGSGPASTAATAGTASPPSSVSVDGDFEDANGEAQQLNAA